MKLTESLVFSPGHAHWSMLTPMLSAPFQLYHGRGIPTTNEHCNAGASDHKREDFLPANPHEGNVLFSMNNTGLLTVVTLSIQSSLLAGKRERERFTASIQPAWLMRTGLFSCLSLLQHGNETMADRLLVLVPHELTHAPRSILEQARKLGLEVTEMRAIKHKMELIAHSLCIANGAPAKVARDGWPGKTALLNGQSMGTKSELHQSPEFADAHWQLIVGLKSQITRPAKPMVICA